MPDFDLHREYSSSGESIADLFDSVEEGFFVPAYQREYTWEEENINQLFDDIVLGTRDLIENPIATTFLGTTILTTLTNKSETVVVGDDRAQPTSVQLVIDGQQRISTLALVSIQITDQLNTLSNLLPNNEPYEDFKMAAAQYSKRLMNVYSIELGKGAEPPRKPKIISGRENDRWAHRGTDISYISQIARYVASYIRLGKSDDAIASLDSTDKTRVLNNVNLIKTWIDAICNAHLSTSLVYDQFPVGSKIADRTMQEFVLGFYSEDVLEIVTKPESDRNTSDLLAISIYQLLLFSHYLLYRCGVNRLQPSHEEWGFDMFQSLNTTGTPLTVIETFLPQVMQAEISVEDNWSESPSQPLMNEIQRIFDATNTNEQKTKRTNEVLSSFALCLKGRKLGNKFSDQRRWLSNIYTDRATNIDEQRTIVNKLNQVARFYYYAWHQEDSDVPNYINGLDINKDGALATFLIRYLKDAKSQLSSSLLARFYSQLTDGETTTADFVDCVKSCAAFFTLWRAANSTSGLDEQYRKFFRRHPLGKGYNWSDHTETLSVSKLKQYFIDVLAKKGIEDFESWSAGADRFLLFTEIKTVCKFALFVAAHDRLPDLNNPGLTLEAQPGTCTMLTLERWLGKDCKSLEHIAPVSPPEGHGWSNGIYESRLVHQVGNLMLLPVELNHVIANKSWEVKFLHYIHVGRHDKLTLKQMEEAANQKGIVLSKEATKLLTNIEYSCTIDPILEIGEQGTWDPTIIHERSIQIKQIVWDTLYSWLTN